MRGLLGLAGLNPFEIRASLKRGNRNSPTAGSRLNPFEIRASLKPGKVTTTAEKRVLIPLKSGQA